MILTMSNEKILETNKHISDEEVNKDIYETEKEIYEFQQKIDSRREFIDKLKYLLHLRNNERKDEYFCVHCKKDTLHSGKGLKHKICDVCGSW